MARTEEPAAAAIATGALGDCETCHISSMHPACTPCVLMLVAWRSPRLMPPCVGFRATLPQNAAGRVMEPPTCVPMAAGIMRAASAAAGPEDDRPAVPAGWKGFALAGGGA